MKAFTIRVGLCGVLAASASSVSAQPSSPSNTPQLPSGITVQAPVARPSLPSGIAVPPQAVGALQVLPLWPNDPVSWTGLIQDPFSGISNASIEALVGRASALGNIQPNYQRIAETLDKGFPNLLGGDSLGFQAKKKAADQGIRLAGNEPNAQVQPPPQPQPPLVQPQPDGRAQDQFPNGQDNAFKQTIDEINKIFKTQADLIRSIDVGAVNRGNTANGVPNGDTVRVVLTGRTGLELGVVAPEVLDHFKIPRTQGLIVREVYPDTPAAAAGYKKGDILLEFNNRIVPSNLLEFIERVMSSVKNNTPIPAIVLRGSDRMKVSDMQVTDRRVIPALPNERLPDLTSLIRVVPGINSDQPSTNTVPEYRIIRNGLTTEIIPVYPPNAPNKK